MEHELWKTKRAGFFGQRPIGRAALAEWQRDIERRVARMEKALGENKPKQQLKLKVKP